MTDRIFSSDGHLRSDGIAENGLWRAVTAKKDMPKCGDFPLAL
jgi:hypothetical protein